MALILTTALAGLFLFIPLISPETSATWAESGTLCGMALVGVASAGVTLQSARHGGRWGWVGLALGLFYLVVPWTIPYFVGVVHLTVLPAGFTTAIAVANTFSRRLRE